MAMKKAAKAKAKPAAKPAKKAPAKKAPARKSTGTARTAAAKTSARPSGGFETFSGKFTVRLPRSLHQALVDRAEREGVSLNLFVTNALSREVAAKGRK